MAKTGLIPFRRMINGVTRLSELRANKIALHYFTLTARYALLIWRIYHRTNASPSCTFEAHLNHHSPSCKKNGRRLPRFMVLCIKETTHDQHSELYQEMKTYLFPYLVSFKGENS